MDGIRSGTALKECLPYNVPPRGCQAESIEELKQLLLCTALELQSTRRVAREEMKRHEENIRQLVQHLNTICKERDEAREGCLKLQEKLLQASLSDLHSNIVNIQPDSPAARSLKGESSITECDSISDTCKHHSLVSSPVNSMFEAVSSMEEPFKLNLASSDGMDFFQQPYLELSEQCQRTSFPAQKIQPGYLPLGCGNSRYQNIDIQEHIQLQCESKRELSNPSRICHSSCLLEESSFFQSNPILNVSAPFTECNLSAEHQTSMQPVCTSSAHTPKSNVQHGENILEVQEHMSEQSQEQQSDKHSKLDKDLVPSEYIQSVLPGCEAKKDNQSHNGKLCSHKITERDTLWHVPESIVDDYQMASSCSPSSVLHPPSITNHGIAKLPSRSPSPPGGTEISSNLIQSKKISDPSPNVVVPPVSVHLPEPPEADPQVIMNSLPEKGKLLQAVMKAGPLLQTLLLAGSLPQWQQPPPALNSCEIPLVSMPSIPTPVHPVLNPPQLNSPPVHDNVNLMHKSPSSFCSQNQSGISQIPPATLLPPSAKTTNLSSNKRPLFIPPVNGEAVQDTKPSHKYAKLQQHVDPTALN